MNTTEIKEFSNPIGKITSSGNVIFSCNAENEIPLKLLKSVEFKREPNLLVSVLLITAGISFLGLFLFVHNSTLEKAIEFLLFISSFITGIGFYFGKHSIIVKAKGQHVESIKVSFLKINSGRQLYETMKEIIAEAELRQIEHERANLEKLVIKPTDTTPFISLNNKNGIIKIKGRALPDDVKEFFAPILDWLDNYSHAPHRFTKVYIAYEYLKTGASNLMVDIFNRLEKIDKTVGNVTVNWYYEEGDEDMREKGQLFDAAVNLDFKVMKMKNSRY